MLDPGPCQYPVECAGQQRGPCFGLSPLQVTEESSRLFGRAADGLKTFRIEARDNQGKSSYPCSVREASSSPRTLLRRSCV